MSVLWREIMKLIHRISNALFALIIVGIIIFPSIALAVNYNVSGSDPTGDVMLGYSEVGGYSYIDITYLASRESGSDIVITLRCAGDLVYRDDVTYGITVLFQYGDSSNIYGLGIGYCSVQQNVFYFHNDGSYSRIDSATFSRNGNELTIRFPKSGFSTPPGWYLHATTTDLSEGVQDIATAETGASASPSWIPIVLVLVVIVVIGFVIARKRGSEKRQSLGQPPKTGQYYQQPAGQQQFTYFPQETQQPPLPQQQAPPQYNLPYNPPPNQPSPPHPVVSQQSIQSPPAVCPFCGKPVEAGWITCPFCGGRLK